MELPGPVGLWPGAFSEFPGPFGSWPGALPELPGAPELWPFESGFGVPVVGLPDAGAPDAGAPWVEVSEPVRCVLPSVFVGSPGGVATPVEGGAVTSPEAPVGASAGRVDTGDGAPWLVSPCEVG